MQWILIYICNIGVCNLLPSSLSSMEDQAARLIQIQQHLEKSPNIMIMMGGDNRPGSIYNELLYICRIKVTFTFYPCGMDFTQYSM